MSKVSFPNPTQVYMSLDKHVADGKLTVTDGRELEQLHFILRDFAVLLQVSQIKVRSRSDQGQIKGQIQFI